MPLSFRPLYFPLTAFVVICTVIFFEFVGPENDCCESAINATSTENEGTDGASKLINMPRPRQSAAPESNTPRRRFSAGEVKRDARRPAPKTVVLHTIAYPDESDPINSVSADGSYYVAVSYAIEQEVAQAEDLDLKRLLVTASIGNQSGSSISVRADSLVLVDEYGALYAPDMTTDAWPALVGATINPDDTLVAFASFDVPEDVEEPILELCPNQSYPCIRPLQARVPLSR